MAEGLRRQTMVLRLHSLLCSPLIPSSSRPSPVLHIYNDSGSGVGTVPAFRPGISMNHFQAVNLTLSPSTWGVVNSQTNIPMQIEINACVFF
jgi:hypothetical protein